MMIIDRPNDDVEQPVVDCPLQIRERRQAAREEVTSLTTAAKRLWLLMVNCQYISESIHTRR